MSRTSISSLLAATPACARDCLDCVDERKAVQKIESTFAKLDEDRARFGTPFRPAPGSPLAVDDRRWASSPLSQHAWTSVSYTHLRAHETDSYLVCRLLL